jgi:hypothetical protein
MSKEVLRIRISEILEILAAVAAIQKGDLGTVIALCYGGPEGHWQTPFSEFIAPHLSVDNQIELSGSNPRLYIIPISPCLFQFSTVSETIAMFLTEITPLVEYVYLRIIYKGRPQFSTEAESQEFPRIVLSTVAADHQDLRGVWKGLEKSLSKRRHGTMIPAMRQKALDIEVIEGLLSGIPGQQFGAGL